MPRVTIHALSKLAAERKLVMLTAYDAPSARMVDGVADMILVGDSVATVVQGKPTTIGVTMDEMVYHARLVTGHSTQALVIGDMPFLSYQTSARDAVFNAGRFLKEAGCQAVKLEGGVRSLKAVKAIIAADIPVMGHIGFTPQSIHKVAGAVVNRDAQALLADAQALEAAGVFALVLECVPTEIARSITAAVAIPTIGIGSGPHCTGQVLVFHDLLGFDPTFRARHFKQYFDFHAAATKALKTFRDDVITGGFPGDEHGYR